MKYRQPGFRLQNSVQNGFRMIGRRQKPILILLGPGAASVVLNNTLLSHLRWFLAQKGNQVARERGGKELVHIMTLLSP